MPKESEIENRPDDSCTTLIDETVADTPGVVGVELDTRNRRVAVDYAPEVLSVQDAERLAARIVQPLQDRFATCTLRLGAQGGRACESCAQALEAELKQIPGVRRASASYRSGTLRVIYDAQHTSPDELARTVRTLEVPEEQAAEEAVPAPPGRWIRWFTLERLEALFTAITLVAMVIGFVAEKTGEAVLSTVAYVVAYVAGGAFGVKASWESLRLRTIDIDLLMVLAALGAAAIGAPFEGAMLLFLFSLSNVLQNYAIGRTRSAIQALMKLRPEQALVRRDGVLHLLPVEEVAVGDVFVLKPGDRVPLDGVVLSGRSSLDQSSVTGESVPVSKEPGDAVLAGTINENGSLEVRVTKRAQESTIARLIQLVEEARSEKAGTQRFIDTAEQYYAVGVIAFTLLAIAVPIALMGEAFAPAFYRAMTLMVAASPCALVISTPATVLSAIGNGARRGVLFKGGAYVEQAAAVKAIAFDKTGTLTEGKRHVTDVRLLDGNGWTGTKDDLLTLAAAVQAKSEHSLAEATVAAARERSLAIPEADAFQATVGRGVRAVVDGQEVRIGNLRYFDERTPDGLEAARKMLQMLEAQGKTSVLVAQERAGTLQALGIIAFADVLRPGARDVVQQLKSLGVEYVVMLTGDNEAVAKQIAAEAGLDEYYAELLPEEKMRLLKKIARTYGPVAMVGDGVNDAPALATASLGIAMGAAGTDVALETADIVLMADDLEKIPYVIALSRRTRRTLVANLGFALTVIVVMVASILTVGLALPLAVVGHEGSTVLVSLNGLRLLAFKHHA